MANTLKFGNGQWATGTGTALAYNDENANYKPLPFDFTRASSGTTVNQSGLIETVGSGTPRIDFEGNTKGSLLLEPSRTNLITYSEDFSQGNWIKTDVTVSSNQTISPDGTLNADLIIASPTTSTHKLQTSQSVNSELYPVSVYVKAGGYNNVQIASWATGANYINFNVTNGTVTKIGSVAPTIYGIESVGNGWYRVWANVQASGSGTVGIHMISADDSVWNEVFTGDGVSGLYLWGAMIEANTFASSYIPTSGSTVTRVADACNNGANEQVINSTEGVLYAEVSGFSNDIVRYSISDGSNSNNIYIELSSSSVSAVGRLSAVNQFSIYSSQTITNYNKIAIKYKQNDFALWINGVEVGTDTSGNTYPANTLDSFQFNRGDGGIYFYGETRDIKVYNTALTDAELKALTT